MVKAIRSFFHVSIPDAATRTWGLDLIRCIAVLDIVKIHMWQIFYCQRFNMNIPNVWPIKGVQLFFVLSGFLIGGIIIRQTENRGWQPVNMLRFMCRRWFRTLPNYYAVLLVNIALQYLLNGTEGLKYFSFHFFFFTYNLASPMIPFFMEAWSIAVEEWFYLLYALSAGALYSILSPQRQVKAISISIALVMIIIPTSLRFTPYYHSIHELENSVVFSIDGIGYGVVAAWFYYYYSDRWHRMRWLMFALGALLLYLRPIPEGYWQRIFLLSLLSTGYVLFLPVFNSIKKAPPIIGYVVQVISQLSYSMYLLNLSVVATITVSVFSEHSHESIILITSFYLILLWVLCLLFYKLIERPFLELRDKYYP